MKSSTIHFGSRPIGPTHPPFIIAEMSGNHNHSLERALAIVDAAADAGADAVKIQTYTADTMTLNLNEREFRVTDPKSLWKGYSLYQLYQKAHTPWDWHAAIFKRCRERGILGFSTPFDSTAVDFLQALRVPLFKIASFENIDIPLIKKVAKTGKPIIVSTGMATLAEIQEAVDAVRSNGGGPLVLLKCTSAYPASARESNLVTLSHLRESFQVEVGLSDHTLGIGASVASIALGACVIERHVTLSREDGGVDSAFSLEPDELKRLVQETRAAWEAQGTVHYGPTAHEKASLIFRRSLYIVKTMRPGERLTKSNLRAIRPGYGLPPKYFETLLGKRVNKHIRAGTALTWELIA